MTVQQMAQKILAVMDRDEAYGSTKITRLAGLHEEDQARVLQILKKLREMKRVGFREGRWVLK